MAARTITAAALCVLFAGCGADREAPPTDKSAGARSQTAADTRSTAETAAVQPAAAPDPTDGRLTTTSGEIITDFGARRDRVAAVQAFAQLQHDFQADRMAAACSRISDFLLTQFTPPGTRDDTPCPRKLEAYAAQRARRGDEAGELRLLWVRSYTGEAGIWVENDRGKRLRIQMTTPPPDATWKYDLGSSLRADVLAATPIDARGYADR